jgi:CHASE3 domain sensor protein
MGRMLLDFFTGTARAAFTRTLFAGRVGAHGAAAYCFSCWAPQLWRCRRRASGWGARGDDRLADARETQRELILGALGALNAETGVRGFVLTADEEFREPYDVGLQQVDASASRLDEIVDDPAARAELQAVLQSFQAWRTQFAEPDINRVRAGALALARSYDSLNQGEALFDDVRADYDVLLARLNADAVDAERVRDRTDVAQFLMMVAAAASLAGFVATLVYVFASKRRCEEALWRTRRELAAQRDLSEESKEILATASHELRNPLPASCSRRRSSGGGQ